MRERAKKKYVLDHQTHHHGLRPDKKQWNRESINILNFFVINKSNCMQIRFFR